MLARPENRSKVERLTAEIDAFGRTKVPTFEDLDKFPWLEVGCWIPLHLLPADPGYLRVAISFLWALSKQLQKILRCCRVDNY